MSESINGSADGLFNNRRRAGRIGLTKMRVIRNERKHPVSQILYLW